MSLESEYLELQKLYGEKVTVHQIHDWAKANPTSDWYQRLEWDNEAAGYNWRLHQIRNLLIIIQDKPTGMRKMISLKMDRASGGGYRYLEDIRQTPQMVEMLLNEVLEEIDRLLKKHAVLEHELRPVRAAVDALREERRKRGPEMPGSESPAPL